MRDASRVLIATSNPHKIAEFREIFADLPIELVTPDEAGLTVSLEETGATFEQNAILKALAYADASGLLALADDSGLEIDALHGEPGVYSARWAGEDVTYPQRFAMLFERLRGVAPAERTARYRCSIALAAPAPLGLYAVVDGTLEGQIANEPRGSAGFGYDPIFFVPDADRTVAEMTAEEKHRISHRGKAGRAAAEVLRHLL